MLLARAARRADDPETDRQQSIANLPKDCTGENNGNWRGGITKQTRGFRTQQSTRFTKWRQGILERDGYRCKDCGTLNGPFEVHHIIPLAETTSTAFLPMNGVTLCRPCHAKTDTYCGRGHLPRWGNMLPFCTVRTIPHRFQAYPTVGNWQWVSRGLFKPKLLVIFVSELGSQDYEICVAVHEYIEAVLCRWRRISAESVDAFDLMFEREREDGLHAAEDEPGDSPKAPYRREHRFATVVEQMLAKELDVDWQVYERSVEALTWKG